MPGSHACICNPCLKIPHEHPGDKLRTAQHGARPAVVKIKRKIAISINAGGHDDAQFGRAGDALDPRNIASQPKHGQIDDRVDAARLQLVHPRDGVRNTLLFVAPFFRIVVLNIGIEYENVLMH